MKNAEIAELFTDSAESTSAVFTALYNHIRPTMKGYISDLVTIDRGTIESNPGTPFIFGARETGTGLSLLYPNMEAYENAGLKIGARYLFGTIQDERHKIEIMHAQAQQVIYKGTGNKLFYYFDGTKLRRSTCEQCAEIHRAHVERVISAAKPHIDLYNKTSHQLITNCSAW